jgi:DNA-binding response OmpR family regulator
MRVLIAEDDSALANFVRKGLEAEHYVVDVTTDGEQARAMAGGMDYDLLMLDLNHRQYRVLIPALIRPSAQRPVSNTLCAGTNPPSPL